MGLGGLSTSIFARRDSLFSEGDIERVREASKNGSLVRRASIVLLRHCRKVSDVGRLGVAEIVHKNAMGAVRCPYNDGGVFGEDASSKQSTPFKKWSMA